MSIYRPDPKTLYPARLIDGWWVMDPFGPLAGPIAAENELPGRHISYAESVLYGED